MKLIPLLTIVAMAGCTNRDTVYIRDDEDPGVRTLGIHRLADDAITVRRTNDDGTVSEWTGREVQLILPAPVIELKTPEGNVILSPPFEIIDRNGNQ